MTETTTPEHVHTLSYAHSASFIAGGTYAVERGTCECGAEIHRPIPYGETPERCTTRHTLVTEELDHRTRAERERDDARTADEVSPVTELSGAEEDSGWGDSPAAAVGYAWLIDGDGLVWVCAGADPSGTGMAVYTTATGIKLAAKGRAAKVLRALAIEDKWGIAKRGPLVTLGVAR